MEYHIFGLFHTNKQFKITKCLMAIALVLCFSLCSLLLCSCIGPGPADWQYELPNNYFVFRPNSATIEIHGKNGVVVNNYVTCFAYNEIYVCARSLDLEQDNQYFFDDIMNMDFDNAKYYIINTETGDVYNALTEKEYNTLCQELNIISLCDWIDTYPKPKGAR